MTAQQLKNSILQMAVQGKLVPQDPNDEPASVLLERIRAEKEQLIKQKKIKREKNPSIIFKGADNTPYEKIGNNEPVSLADEIPFDIPENWEWARLGQIIFSRGQCTPQTDFCYIDIGSIDNKHQQLSSEETIIAADKAPSRARKIVSVGDILYSTVRPYLHNMCIIDRDFSCMPIASTGFAVMTCHDGILNKFLFYYLMSPDFDAYANNTDNSKGVAYPAINDDRLYKAFIPIPPTSEQRRIVAKIESLEETLSIYDDRETELRLLNESFPGKLKKSILQMAVQGKLTAQNPSDEPAAVLLERIRSEKEQLIRAGKIKRDKHESVIFRRDNSHYEKRGSVVECIDGIIPFEIPDSWEWVRLETIITSTDAGKSPQCDNRPRKDDEWGVIKTTAIQDGNFVSEENKVLPHGFVVNDAIVVHDGDLLITRAGPRNRTGVVCVVGEEPTNLILSDKTVRLSYMRGFVNPLYIMTALNSPAVQSFVIEAMSGMAASQVNISQEKMKTFLLPLPPFDEQQRIVDAVRALYAQISHLTF